MKKPSKKLVIIIIAAVLVVAIAVAAVAIVLGGGDFGKVKWGMTPDEIRTRASGKIVTDSEYHMTFKTDNLEGVSAETNVFYNFDGIKGLWQVSAGYEMAGFDDKLADKFIKAFEEKYGDEYEYKETLTAYEYRWTNDRTMIRISQQQTYLLVTFTDINYVVEN